MSKRQIALTASLASLLTLVIIASSMLFLSRALAAAPMGKTVSAVAQQPPVDNLAFVSVSALAFMPARQSATFNKDLGRRLLTLNTRTRDFADNSNIFIAPLALPDRSVLTGMTFFGEDFDSEGAVQLRLKRCGHGQAGCNILAEGTTGSHAAGQFETFKISIPNEVVDNNRFSYVLELELTALFNSGLRSARLEIIDRTGISATPGNVERWSLSGDNIRFTLPDRGFRTQVRVCTDDLGHLNNVTHFPILVVDGSEERLSSNDCIERWGREFVIRRNLNTGPSSGTYQFLR